jgi:putative endopeptidase
MLYADEEIPDQMTEDEIKEEMDARWKETISSPDHPMYAALTNAYLENYIDPDTETELREMTASIKATFREMLQKEDWLSKETRDAAIKKLDAMTFTVGSPEEPIDTSYLAVDPTMSLLETMTDLTPRYKSHVLSVNGKLIRDGEVCRYDIVPWFDALEVNAANYIVLNHFYIAPGVMNEYFFSSDMPYEKKLGIMGAVIGHEITHGFDPDGSMYDETGSPIAGDYGFFTPEDAAVFQEKVDKVISYCDSFQFVPFSPLPGEIVRGEVVADMGGMKICLQLGKETEGFDYAEFFSSFAQLWREQTTLGLEEYYVYDEHPCSCFRVNATVQQFEEFYQTFGVKEGDKMYLAPEDRVAIW